MPGVTCVPSCPQGVARPEPTRSRSGMASRPFGLGSFPRKTGDMAPAHHRAQVTSLTAPCLPPSSWQRRLPRPKRAGGSQHCRPRSGPGGPEPAQTSELPARRPPHDTSGLKTVASVATPPPRQCPRPRAGRHDVPPPGTLGTTPTLVTSSNREAPRGHVPATRLGQPKSPSRDRPRL